MSVRLRNTKMDKYSEDPIRPTLEQVSIAEKAHLRVLTRAIDQCLENNGP